MDRRWSGFWPVDWLHFFFITAQMVLTASTGMAEWAWWAFFDLGALVGLGAVIALSDGSRSRREAMLRLVHGCVVIPLIFTQVGLTIGALGLPDNAEALEAADMALFMGLNPLEALERIAHPLLTEVMQWAYNSYLLLPPIAVLLLAVRGSPRVIGRSLFSLVLVLYLSYLGYYLVPAMGPNIHNNFGPLAPVDGEVLQLYTFSDPLPGVWATQWLREVMFAAELTKKDCFPSGHVAMALACVACGFRVGRVWGLLLLPIGLGVVLSTMYLRYHYVVDVIAGSLLAFACLTVLQPSHDRFADVIRSPAPDTP